jgi:hypothetical protein
LRRLFTGRNAFNGEWIDENWFDASAYRNDSGVLADVPANINPKRDREVLSHWVRLLVDTWVVRAGYGW